MVSKSIGAWRVLKTWKWLIWGQKWGVFFSEKQVGEGGTNYSFHLLLSFNEYLPKKHLFQSYTYMLAPGPPSDSMQQLVSHLAEWGKAFTEQFLLLNFSLLNYCFHRTLFRSFRYHGNSRMYVYRTVSTPPNALYVIHIITRNPFLVPYELQRRVGVDTAAVWLFGAKWVTGRAILCRSRVV